MNDSASFLAPWSNFYIMMGSAAGALTGLMFVVITIVQGRKRQATDFAISTFSTPTVVHFCAALFISAALVAPWRSTTGLAVLLGIAGLCGTVYSLRVMYRTKRLKSYSPDIEDWFWYAIFPFIAYAVLLGGASALPTAPAEALFTFAASVVLLTLIAIRNAWDVVTYIIIEGVDDTP
jgi:uncharacterized protein with PQ loop repeat